MEEELQKLVGKTVCAFMLVGDIKLSLNGILCKEGKFWIVENENEDHVRFAKPNLVDVEMVFAMPYITIKP